MGDRQLLSQVSWAPITAAATAAWRLMLKCAAFLGWLTR